MAGSTNFVQVNPNQNNQESSDTFAADIITLGGFGTGAIVPGQWLNKFCYDVTTCIAALNDMLALKGYNVSSASRNTLAAVYANLLTRSDQRAPLTLVSYSPNPQFNAAVSDGFQIALSGNVSPTIVGQSPGQIVKFIISQDGSGNRVWNWPSNIVGGGTVGSSAFSVSIQLFVVDESNTLRPATPMTVS